MLATVDRTDAHEIALEIVRRDHDKDLAVLGSLLHRMASESETVLEIIDHGITSEEESALVEMSCVPIDNLARLILRSPHDGEAGQDVKARARAWLDGCYTAKFGDNQQ